VKHRWQFASVLLLSLFNSLAVAEPSKIEDPKTRLAKAEAIFQDRCKKSGEFIYETAENVDGVLLLKIRESYNRNDQYRMDDPYGHDSWGEEYFKSFFLEPMLEANKYASPEILEKIRRDYRGYRYVDAIDPKDGKRYRYTGSMKSVGKMDANAHNVQVDLKRNPNFDLNIYRYVLDKIPASGSAPRYGVTYDDISTREERDYWIAGSSLKVIDLKTNEVMAERIGYMMDRGQGNNSGGRSAWLWAAGTACPQFGTVKDRSSVPGFTYQTHQTRKFVTKILHPIQEK
jgi:hypothetical protein